MTPQGRPEVRLRRALQQRSLVAAELAARELAFIPLSQARELVELYAENGSPKYDRAALKYLRRYMDEDPEASLTDVAQVAVLLAERALLMQGR